MSDFRLKAFASIAHHLSFTKAARELGVSQPALSKHVKELERMYGARLFERRGASIKLTQAGELLLQHATGLLNAYARLEFDMHLLQGVRAGLLRVGASTTISQYVLPPLLAKFSEKFPDVRITLFSGNSQAVEQALQDGEIDLGMVEGKVRQPMLRYTHFMEDELVLVASTDSSYARMEEISLAELKQVPLVLRENGSGTLDVLQEALRGQHLDLADLNLRLQLGSSESIKLFLRHSDCASILSFRCVERELTQGLLHVIEIPELVMTRHLEFVQLLGKENPLPMLFLQFVQHYHAV